MFRVAWKFCSTRIIIATMMHLVSIICGLGVCVFAKFCLESIVEMDEQKKIVAVSSFEIFSVVLYHNTLININCLFALVE